MNCFNFIDYQLLISEITGIQVDRPNKHDNGTLSGHAAGEPFEKCVYHYLKEKYPNNIFKQYEYLNDIYLRNPTAISVQQKNELLNSPTVLFLLSRGDKATKEWSPENIFEEKQNDTADIVCFQSGYYELIDVKTRNVNKSAQPPNIISAYKLAKTCANMIENAEYDKFSIKYVEIDWSENGDKLKCNNVHCCDLFKIDPNKLYINWAAAMQIQFHVADMENRQDWTESVEKWARRYIQVFVNSARTRCKRMEEMYITPFLKYIQ